MSQFHILIVDDEKNVAQSIVRALRSEIYTIETRENVDAALEYLKSHGSVELILSDYSMPLKTGVELFKEVKESHPTIIRFLMSAFEDFNEIVQALNEGTVEKFFKKPWDNDILSKSIQTALDQRKFLQEGLKSGSHLDMIEMLENMHYRKFLDHLEFQIDNIPPSQSLGLVVIGIDNMREVYIQHGIKKYQEVRGILYQETLKVIKNQYFLSTIDDATLAMIIPFDGQIEALEHQVKGILDSLVKPYILHQTSIEPVLKVGISLYPEHGASSDFLLKNAQEALFKCLSPKGISIYHPKSH